MMVRLIHQMMHYRNQLICRNQRIGYQNVRPDLQELQHADLQELEHVAVHLDSEARQE